MSEQGIPVRKMSMDDYGDIKHILESCHDNERYYNAGTILLEAPLGLKMIPSFDINEALESVTVTDRTFELVNDLESPGTFTVYSTPLKKLVSLGKYFEKRDKRIGMTSYDVYNSVWKTIETSKKTVVHKYNYSVDNIENISERLEFMNLKSLAEESLLGKFPDEFKNIPGISTPYAYYGTTGSIAGIHVEDSDFMSLNVNIWGSSKHWLSTGEANREKVIEIMTKSDSTFKEFPNHYRCKMVVMTPNKLKEEGVTIYTGYQNANDIIVTLCGAFHQVTNTGESKHT